MSRVARPPIRGFGDRPLPGAATPQFADEAVTFSMFYQGKNHEIIVPRETLASLARQSDEQTDLAAEFNRHYARIVGVAGRILCARHGLSPLLLKSDFFR